MAGLTKDEFHETLEQFEKIAHATKLLKDNIEGVKDALALLQDELDGLGRMFRRILEANGNVLELGGKNDERGQKRNS